jgi:hypothetical protein
MLTVYHREAGREQEQAEEMTQLLTTNFLESVESVRDLQYNIHILQKPAFEVPNPLILGSVLRHVSNNIVSTGPDATPHVDKNESHNFLDLYMKYIRTDASKFAVQVHDMCVIVQDFFDMYEHNATNAFIVNPLIAASTYMQNNQTELPAMAYHGNLVVDKIKGGRDEVRCVGHLGNSFPGCACIREGKGMVNMYGSMPSAVHVM